jgi:F-type H+-transporting ATPase subunit gamma
MQAVVRSHPLVAERREDSKPRERATIVFGSDQGLCGRFNETLSGVLLEDLKVANHPDRGCRILAVGSRICSSLEAQGLSMDACFQVPGSVDSIAAFVGRILVKIDAWENEGIEEIKLYFNERRTGAVHSPRSIDLMPIQYARFNELQQKPWPSRSLPGYTMFEKDLLAALVRQYLFISIFRAAAESLASEHASRLISMQIAEKNIKERLESLSAEFRQQRQNRITEEILDVVAASEMLRV